jgi:hypothetical protein
MGGCDEEVWELANGPIAEESIVPEISITSEGFIPVFCLDMGVY